MNIVLPVNIEFLDWANQLRISLPNITIPIPKSVNEWRAWASQVVFNNKLTNVPLPTDLAYPKNEDWKKWAAFFVNTAYSIK